MNKYYKFLLIFIATLLVVGGSLLIFNFSNARKQQVRDYNNKLSQVQYDIQSYRQAVKKDKFGGTSPLATCELFLNSLQKENISLASRYFVIDKQDKYQQLLSTIKQGQDWKSMLEDLLASKNNGQYKDSGDYIIPIIDKQNDLITTVHLIKVNNIWKIAEF